MNDRRAFVLRRLFSASGVFPLGVFVVYHLVALLKLTAGPPSSLGEPSKLTLVLETLVIGVPLAFHAIVGVLIGLSARPNVDRYPFRANWSYTLMRVTGLISLVFIVAHLWEFRVRLLLGQVAPVDFFTELVASLSSTGPGNVPYVAAGYLIGLAATTYHLAIGIQGFCASFGLVSGRRQSERLGTICAIAGVVLFAIGASGVIYLASGGNPLGA